MSEKQKVPVPLSPELVEKTWTARESWRVFGIMSEFVEATERLAHIPPAVSIFGSARVPRGHPYYQLTEDVARRLRSGEHTSEIQSRPYLVCRLLLVTKK